MNRISVCHFIFILQSHQKNLLCMHTDRGTRGWQLCKSTGAHRRPFGHDRLQRVCEARALSPHVVNAGMAALQES
jgi:hypothetical protein